MKKQKSILVVSVVVLLCMCVLMLAGCNSDNEPPYSSDNEGVYSLVEITGLSGVSVSSYDYNYIALNSDGTYELKNKANGVVSEQTGKYSIDSNGDMTLTEADNDQNFFISTGESITCKNDELFIEGYISGYGNVTMTFVK